MSLSVSSVENSRIRSAPYRKSTKLHNSWLSLIGKDNIFAKRYRFALSIDWAANENIFFFFDFHWISAHARMPYVCAAIFNSEPAYLFGIYAFRFWSMKIYQNDEIPSGERVIKNEQQQKENNKRRACDAYEQEKKASDSYSHRVFIVSILNLCFCERFFSTGNRKKYTNTRAQTMNKTLSEIVRTRVFHSELSLHMLPNCWSLPLKISAKRSSDKI